MYLRYLWIEQSIRERRPIVNQQLANQQRSSQIIGEFLFCFIVDITHKPTQKE